MFVSNRLGVNQLTGPGYGMICYSVSRTSIDKIGKLVYIKYVREFMVVSVRFDHIKRF